MVRSGVGLSGVVWYGVVLSGEVWLCGRVPVSQPLVARSSSASKKPTSHVHVDASTLARVLQSADMHSVRGMGSRSSARGKLYLRNNQHPSSNRRTDFAAIGGEVLVRIDEARVACACRRVDIGQNATTCGHVQCGEVWCLERCGA